MFAMMCRRSHWFVSCVLLLVFGSLLAPEAYGLVGGTRPTQFKTFKVFGSAEKTGNSMMSASPPGNVNDILLPQTSAAIRGVPFDGKLVAAYVWWTGSTLNIPDRVVDFTVASGKKQSITADTCFTVAVPQLGNFFYCRKDITNLLKQQSPKQLNGTYTLGNLSVRRGICGRDRWCQARYGAWSMVLVWESPTFNTRRDIVLYDGFLFMDEDAQFSGITNINLAGFRVGNPPEGRFTYFGLEGDQFLGSPPEPPSNADFISFRTNSSARGTRLSSSTPNNPSGNLWNSTIALSVDIDTFNIGQSGLNLLKSGDTSATLVAGAGDGVVCARPGNGNWPCGDGELVFLGYMLLTVDTLTPNFRNKDTNKRVDKRDASAGDVLTYTIEITNTGSLDGKNTIVRDAIPANTTYVPNSTKVDGKAVPDVGGTSPLVRGLNLGTVPFRGDNDREITFQVRITPRPNSKRIENFFNVRADGVGDTKSNTVVTTLRAPQLGVFTKSVANQSNPGGPVRPGDILAYTIIGSNVGGAPAPGVQLLDDLPKHVKLISVFPPGGSLNRSSTTGGTNGTGRIDVRNITIPSGTPPANTVRIVYTVRVFNEAEFATAGVKASDIDGTRISNQGEARQPALPGNLKTDDPRTPAKGDPTIVTISYKANLTTSTKTVRDGNGGRPEPGDTLTYTMTFKNTGTRNTTVRWEDPLPPGVDSFAIGTTPPGGKVQFQQPPAGANKTGLLTVTGITLNAGQTVTMTFTVKIQQKVVNGQRITNIGTLIDEKDTSNKVTLTSQTLIVIAGPILNTSTKRVQDINGGVFAPGDTVRYTVTVRNTGNRPATDVVVRDLVDTKGLENIQVQGGVFDAAKSQITWDKSRSSSLASIAASGSVTLTFTARIKRNLADQTPISNQANIGTPAIPNTQTPTDDPNTPPRGDATVFRVTSKPILGMTKTVRDNNGAPARPGDTVTYTITLRNTGTGAAQDVVVSDKIDSKLTNIRPSNNGRFANGTIVWDKANVPGLASFVPGRPLVLTFTATLRSPLVNGTVISNQASVQAKDLSAVLSDNPATPQPRDPTNITVVSLVRLTFTKVVRDLNGGQTVPGDDLLYTLTVQNTTGSTALLSNLIITDAVPSQLENIRPGNGGTLAGTTITWNSAGNSDLRSLPPGRQVLLTFTARVKANTPNNTSVSNQAILRATGLSGTQRSDDPGTAVPNDPTIVRITSNADLSTTTKTVTDVNGGQLLPGDTVNYTIVLTNTGNIAASNVVVTDAIDTNLTNVRPNNSGTFANGSITWRVGNVAARGVVTLTFTAQVKSPITNGTVIKNQAVLTGSNITRTLSDDPSTPAQDDTTNITVTSGPSFADTTKEVVDRNGGQVNPGDVLVYTITVRNTGTDIGRNLVITDKIETTKINQIKAGQGGTFANGTITWRIPSLAVNQSVQLTFEATVLSNVTNSTPIDNQAEVRSTRVTTPEKSDDPRTAQADDPTRVVVVAGADLTTSTKTVLDNNGGSVQPGDTLTYTIEIKNTGTGVARQVRVTDKIDRNLINVRPNNGRFANGTITWDPVSNKALASIAQGKSVKLTFTAQVAPGILAGTGIDNQAFATATDITTAQPTDDPTTPVLDDPTTVVVGGAAKLNLTKRVRDVNGGTAEPGDVLEYTITVFNQGNSIAQGLVINDPIDANLVSVTPRNNGTFDANNRRIIWTLAPLRPNARVTVTFQATIRSGLPNQTRIRNQAQGTAQGITTPALSDDPTTPTTGDSTDVVISSPLRIRFTKTVRDENGGSFRPGDSVLYTITLNNQSRTSLSRLIVTDQIDPNLEQVQLVSGGGRITGNNIRWDFNNAPGLRTLGAQQSTSLTFRARIRSSVTNGTRILNQALVSAQGLTFQLKSDDPRTPQADDATVILISFADLSAMSKEVRDLNGGSFEPGDTVEYRITVRNSSTTPLNQVVITDKVDTSNLENIQVGPGGGSLSGDTITWNSSNTSTLLQVQQNRPVILTFTARIRSNVANGTRVANQAFGVSREITQPVPSDDPNTVATDDPTAFDVRRAPNLSNTTKEVADNNGGQVRPGDTLTYTITVRNNGSEQATQVVVADQVDPRLTSIQFPAGSPQGTVQGGVITWNVGTIAANTNRVLRFTAIVDRQTPDGTEIANQALVRSAELNQPERSDDPRTPAVDDSTKVLVRSRPDLTTSTKAVRDINGGTPEAGDEIEYTILVTNSGNVTATNVRLIDIIPANTTFVPNSLRLNGTVITNGENTLRTGLTVQSARANTPQGTLLPDDGASPSDEAAEVIFRVRINPGTARGTRIRNQGLLSGSGIPPTRTDNPATQNILGDPTDLIVGGGPDLANTTKTVRIAVDQQTPGIADIGDTLEYTIVIENTGAGSATQIELRDPLPSNTQYVAGSITLNGTAQTDQAGDDAAEIQNSNLLLIRLTTLAANQRATIRFRVQIRSGEQVVNQGVVRASNFPNEPTDADPSTTANEPTVIPIGNRSSITAIKEVVDVNAETVNPGDLLEYRITLRNNSPNDVAGVDVRDPVPANTTYVANSAQGTGTINYDTISRTVSFTNIPIPSGQSVLLVFRVKINDNVAAGTEIVNRAVVAAPLLQPFSTNEAKVTVQDATPSEVVLQGRIYQDFGNDDTRYDANEDEALPGFKLSLYPEGKNEALQTVTAGEGGQFRFEKVPAGKYELRYFTSQDVQFGVIKELNLQQPNNQRDVLVEPTGRLYDSESGEAIADALVYLVYNNLQGSCEKDADCANDGLCIKAKPSDKNGQCGEKVPEADLLEKQQGQKSDLRGMYKFTVPSSTRAYRIEVRPTTSGVVFPSTRIPAESGVINVKDLGAGGKVVANDKPDPKDRQKNKYYLSFSVNEAGLTFQNNHLPLEAASSLLILTKKASVQVATVGDIITYNVELENASSADLRFDPATKNGGVYITDILPRGLRMMMQTPRLFRADGRFIITKPQNTRRNGVANQTPQRLFRFGPFDLPAQSKITLRYQVVVAPNLPVGEYVNIAYAHNRAGGKLSKSSSAMVKITYDPIFDQGTVIGKVFCDKNKNRWPDSIDEGIEGVKIYLDNGHYAITDKFGKYHIQAIDPGNHVMKLDIQSLPPGSKMVDNATQIFYISRGLLRKVNFAVSCRTAKVGVQRVMLKRKRKPKPKLLPVYLEGDVNTPSLRTNKRSRVLPLVDLSVTAPGQLPNYNRNSGLDFNLQQRRLPKPLMFHFRTAAGTRVAQWRLDIYRKGRGKQMGLLMYTSRGVGTPPPFHRWKGKNALGRFLLRSNRLYVARFTVNTLDNTISQSPPKVFGIEYTKRPPKQLYRRKYRADLMGRRGVRVRGRLRRALRRLRRPLGKLLKDNPTSTLLVEVHHDNSIRRQRALFLTVRRSAAITRYLQRLLKLPENRIKPVPRGASRPLLPNISRRNRRKNRRIILRLQVPQASNKTVPILRFSPRVLLGRGKIRTDLRLDAKGRFRHVVKPPIAKDLRIRIRTRRGLWVELPVKPNRSKNLPGVRTISKHKLRHKHRRLAKVKRKKAKKKAPRYPLLHPSVALRQGKWLFEFSDTAQSMSHLDPSSQPRFKLHLASIHTNKAQAKRWKAARQGKLSRSTRRVAQKAKATSTVKAKPRPAKPRPAKKTKARSKKDKKKKKAAPKYFWKAVPLSKAKGVQAAQLKVKLPPQGVIIRREKLKVTGSTNPRNKLVIGGTTVKVNKDGSFRTFISLKHGQTKLKIQTQDVQGNRGEIVWPVKVNLNRMFLMAFAEGTITSKNNRLEGLDSIAQGSAGGMLFNGRAVLYAKGRILGKHFLQKIFKKIKYTAYMETPKKRELMEFYQNLIDPDRFYPVYGDSGKQVQDVTARGWRMNVGGENYRFPVYLLVEADRSKLRIGNFRTQLQGIELARYERTYYGVDIDFKKRFAKNFDTQARFFLSDGDNRQLKAHVQLRGTGGSLYYLKHSSVLEGSEQVRITIRDKDSGIILHQIPMQRNQNYVIQYFDGRIFFKQPIPSVVDSFLITQHNLYNTLDGNPVFVEVDYEYEQVGGQNSNAVGVRLSQSYKKNIKVGFTFAREGRGEIAGPAYQLLGVDLTLKYNKNTFLQAEYARSWSFDSQSFLSTDGGLTYRALQGFQNQSQYGRLRGQRPGQAGGLAEAQVGNAVMVRGQSDIGELLNWKAKDKQLFFNSYFTYRERSFFATGQAPEQGTIKGGFILRGELLRKHKLQLKYDAGQLLRYDLITNQAYDYEKHVFNMQYSFIINKDWDVVVEYAHTSDFDSRDGLTLHGNFVTLGGNWKVNKQLSLLLRQQLAFATQSREPLQVMDHFATTLGVNLRVFRDTYLSGTGTIRWSGNTSAQIGLKTKLSETAETYIREQVNFNQQSTGLTQTLVIGASNRISKNTRVYGEYQMEGASSANNSRAVFGLSHMFPLFRGVMLGVGMERAQFLNPQAGVSSRTVGRVGVQLTRFKNIKGASRFELRYDAGDTQTDTGDRIQFVTTNNFLWKASKDLSFLARVNYALTYNYGLNGGLGGAEGEMLEMSTGLAFRPVRYDWVQVLLKYTLRQEQRPLGLTDNRFQRATTEVFSLIPIFELPFRLQILEQVAVKFRREESDGMLAASSINLLWINRINFHLLKKLDLGVEYRLLWSWHAAANRALGVQSFDAQTSSPNLFDHGVLIEASYLVHQYVHVGVGYNFTRFTDNLFLDDSRDYSGFFLRVIGKF